MTPLLELRRIARRYGGVRALDGVDLDIRTGEIHALVGENGCGKSTLIKIMTGVERPAAGGTVALDGHDVTAGGPAERRRLGIQVIYQDLSLFPNLSVAENIAIGRHLGRLHRVDRKAMRQAAPAARDRLGIALDLDRQVGELAIADRQLVAICRALAEEARLVVMDEPTASLTRTEVDALLARMRDLTARGIAVLFVSHRLDEVLEVADRVTVLRDGRRVATVPPVALTEAALTRMMTGHAFHYDPPQPATGLPVVLEVEGLSRAGQYRDVSFRLHAGEVLGLTGLLGAGRTELALSLFGMNPPDAGAIRLCGHALAPADCRAAIAAGIAYVPEDRLARGLALDQPVADNLLATILPRLAGRFGLVPTARRAAAARDWIGRLAIRVARPEQAARTLSGGNQQRVVLAKWLATGPRVLILDSPTVGVDIGARDGIYAVVRNLARAGVAILMISDEIEEVRSHAARVLVMRAGRLVGEFVSARHSVADIRAAVDG